MPTSVPSSTARLSCLCTAVLEPGTLLSSPTLPVIAPEICHCNPCRHTTGSLGSAFPLLKGPPSAKSLEACTLYESTETHKRYFCSVCGTPTFVHVPHRGHWYCSQGVIERDPEQVNEGDEWVKDVVRVTQHKFLDDTGDGGVSARLLMLGGREVECFRTWQDQERMSARDVSAMQEAAETGAVAALEELMVAKCHCGGTDLRIKRANFALDKQGLSERFTEAGDRYIAQFCACRSCRLQSGVPLQPWTYIPPQNFSVAATGREVILGRKGDQTTEGTTLKHYWSSEDVCRSFCSRCGATFFYWCDERPEAVELSMGVVRGKGAMARECVSWRWRVSWREECVDNEIAEAILGE